MLGTDFEDPYISGLLMALKSVRKHLARSLVNSASAQNFCFIPGITVSGEVSFRTVFLDQISW